MIAVAEAPKRIKPQALEYFVTRNEAADVLAVNAATLIQCEEKGLLTRYARVTTLADGRVRELVVYDPREVVKLPMRVRRRPRDAGEIEARVFEALEDAKSIREIVVELRITADEALRIRAQWLEAGGESWALARATRQAIAEILDPFGLSSGSVPELVDAIATLAARVRELASSR